MVEDVHWADGATLDVLRYLGTRVQGLPAILEALMTTNARIRRVSSPAYYLARPADLWLAAFAPRPEARPADRSSCTSEGRGPAAHGA